jgi:endonuclease YncB( thermonuclease family)
VGLCVVAAAHAGLFGLTGDDWSRYDHQAFRVSRIVSGDSIQITTRSGSTETIKLLGTASPDARAVMWLKQQALNQDATLLLQSPQTRDAAGNLLAFVFVDRANLSVELVTEGLAFADRREKTVMDGVIDPAEADARKKKRGMWATLKFDQMPEWRKAWIKTLPGKK